MTSEKVREALYRRDGWPTEEDVEQAYDAYRREAARQGLEVEPPHRYARSCMRAALRMTKVPTDKSDEAIFREALIKIATLTKPGQEMGISEAIDVICDVWNECRVALTERVATQ